MSATVDTLTAPVTFTTGAVKELFKLRDQQELTDDFGLRIGVEGGGCLRGKVNRGGVRWDVMEEMRERGNNSLVGAASRKLPAMGTRAGAMTREGKRKSARGASRHLVAPERGATGT